MAHLTHRRSSQLPLLIAPAIAGFALISYFSKSNYNELTGETQNLEP